MILQSMFK